MKEYHKNPRKISKEELKQLEENIKELGDLSGIIHDVNTDEIIGGNQRSKVIDINNCQIEIIKEFEKPDAQGTLAIGYVIWQGTKLNYRKVDWDEKQREKANITANKLGGNFDLALLKNFQLKDLTNWGFDKSELYNFDIISDSQELGKGLASTIKERSEFFGLTLSFSKEDKYLMELHVKKYGKEKIVEKIQELLK